jgi:dUTP pyrophosphatase
MSETGTLVEPPHTDLLIQRVQSDARWPARMTAGASGMDLSACLNPHEGDLHIPPGRTELVGTGLAFAIPRGFEGQVRPRSSISRRGLLVHVGTIDADYRGEVKVIITNVGTEHAFIRSGDRVAQLVLAPVVVMETRVVDTLPTTERGDGGFGSTGR